MGLQPILFLENHNHERGENMNKEHSSAVSSLSKEQRRAIKNSYKAQSNAYGSRSESNAYESRSNGAEEFVNDNLGANRGFSAPGFVANPASWVIGAVIAVIAILYFAEASAGTWIIFVTGALIALTIWVWASGSPEYRAEIQAQSLYGNASPNFVCPHCHAHGSVRTKKVSRKKGISGAKAMGAFFTNGISMLATGLARKEDATQAHCTNCGSTWDF